MKKKDIIELINANIKCLDNVNFVKEYDWKLDRYFNRILSLSRDVELDKWVNILNEEIKEGVSLYNEGESVINNYKKSCTHEVRLSYSSCFFSHTCCIFCNESIAGNNVITGCSYDDKNRNKYCVSFPGKDTDEDGHFYDGYDKKMTYSIILDIIKNKEDDVEIDLVQEFKKLNLDECKINEEKIEKEFNILIIGGANTLNIGNGAKIKRDINLNSIKLSLALSDDQNIYVDLIDSKDNIDRYEIKEKLKLLDNFRYSYYEDIHTLEKILDERKNIPYDLIIDFSDLYNYEIKEGKIIQTKHNINLNNIFENSENIRIENVNLNEHQLLLYIKEKLNNYSYYYANPSYNKDRYYFLYNDSVFKNERLISNSLNDIYVKVKKLVK